MKGIIAPTASLARIGIAKSAVYKKV